MYTARTWETGQETLKATQQQQITDRYARAIEQIGSDKSVEVRIGGIYALVRIARDSPSDAITIQDVIVAFLLEHDNPQLTTSKQWRPRADTVVAMRTLRPLTKITSQRPVLLTLNLRDANLSAEELSGVYLSDADLTGATIVGAYLTGADLSKASLSGATPGWLGPERSKSDRREPVRRESVRRGPEGRAWDDT
ncbi:pentapeptide repeat-containing protein [Nonomuraea diastatica]|uniref:Pentapeptide repeat-containing protein n=1 Tax=Nonomuraea diastatica TaxID=1848329 RepID=A0A4R4VMI8_9ACTN|nr:pentapeptide repeat-containing protein [Nonomuraea diastatica]TDD03405.1 pentapeptide repeat-containing protein [Nonomuraea diastatica]